MSGLVGAITAAARRVADVCGVDGAGDRIDALGAAIDGLRRGACELRLGLSGPGRAFDPELVVASAAPPPPQMLALAGAIAGAEDAASTWIDAVPGEVLHWGVHAPLSGRRARLFARWQASVEEIGALLWRCAAVDDAGDIGPLREATEITERTFVDMTSIELLPDRAPGYWAHLSLAKRARSGAPLGPRIGRLVGARLANTPWPERWRDRGTAALASSGDDVYASFDPRAPRGLELALGPMERAALEPVAAALGAGADFEATAPVLDALDVRWLSQVTADLAADGSASLAVFVRVAP